MQLSSILSVALLPLLAVAETSTATSTMTMTKTITISRVSTATAFNITSMYMPTGSSSFNVASATGSSTTAGDASPTETASPASPSIDNKNGGSALSATQVVVAGVAGMVMAVLM